MTVTEGQKTAPVQANKASQIPWEVHVHAWQVYAALGHGSQSAERIAERGGFGWSELVLLLDYRDPYGIDFPKMPRDQETRARRYREEGRESLR
jgi:hypothetical protein